MSVLSSSLRRLSMRLLALQLIGNAALLLGAALWLEIPDSHIWELFLSFIFGTAIVAGALILHTCVIRSIRTSQDHSPLWLGATLLAVWTGLLFLPSMLVNIISATSDQRASYWNSQLSAHLRTVFTFRRLYSWQLATFDILVWYIIPALLLPFIIETVTRGLRADVWRSALRVLGQWSYWVSCLAVGLILRWLVFPLVDWQFGHSVAAEIISVALRLGVVYVSTVLLLTWLIAITALLLSRWDHVRDAGLQPVEHHMQPESLD